MRSQFAPFATCAVIRRYLVSLGLVGKSLAGGEGGESTGALVTKIRKSVLVFSGARSEFGDIKGGGR